jgi:hypothetical protein
LPSSLTSRPNLRRGGVSENKFEITDISSKDSYIMDGENILMTTSKASSFGLGDQTLYDEKGQLKIANVNYRFSKFVFMNQRPL